MGHVYRLARDLEEILEKLINIHSGDTRGKYLLDKAHRVLGFEPMHQWYSATNVYLEGHQI